MDTRKLLLVSLLVCCFLFSAFAGEKDQQQVPADDKQQKETEGFRVGEGDVSKPVKTKHVQPVYPEKARKAKKEGVVFLDLLINEKGKVIECRVVKSAPYGLTKSAVKAAKKWRFEPAMRDGMPVSVWYQITVNFQLDQ